MEATPKLNEALVKVQKALKPVLKSTEGQVGTRKYKYADLATVMDACRSLLNESGVAISQSCGNDTNGVCVVTSLRHISGEYIESPCFLPVVERTPQGYGSAITYARRYGLSAILGMVTEEDDDGMGASRTNKPPPPEGMGALSAKLAPSEVRAAKAVIQGAVFPNYGRSKGQPVSGASRAELEYYLGGAKKTLADPAKANFHAKERQLMQAIQAELDRQLGTDEPPPLTDEDMRP